ncbi:MAG TPA: S24 family peptidase [Treponemataceae bacterium]|nr:S24 family peptidase [Treponemataceae bacterium]
MNNIFAKRLRKAMDIRGIKQVELVEVTGISKSAISQYLSGAFVPKQKNTYKLADALNVDPAWLMGKDVDMMKKETRGEYNKTELLKAVLGDITMLPIIGTIRAGEPILAIEKVEGYFPTDSSILSSDKNYFFLKVKGDSMNLEFKEGSLLLIEKTPCVENGEIGVVLVNAHEATVKKIVKNDNMITLIPMSSNHIHTPQMINLEKQQVEIIGKVKMAIKQY